MLTFHKPWRDNALETKVNYSNYVAALRDFMWKIQFPRSILVSIIQCQLNIGSPVDIDEADDIRRSHTNELQGDECIPNVTVDDLEAIVTPDGDTEKYVTDLLDFDLEFSR